MLACSPGKSKAKSASPRGHASLWYPMRTYSTFAISTSLSFNCRRRTGPEEPKSLTLPPSVVKSKELVSICGLHGLASEPECHNRRELQVKIMPRIPFGNMGIRCILLQEVEHQQTRNAFLQVVICHALTSPVLTNGSWRYVPLPFPVPCSL